MAQTNVKIVQLLDTDGITPIAPLTHAKAVTYGETNFGDALEALEINKQDNIKDAAEKDTIEDKE